MSIDQYFVDTGAWAALYNPRDPYYSNAQMFLKNFQHQKIALMTTDYILDESITLIRRRASHSQAITFKNSLDSSSSIKIVSIDDCIRSQAWDIFCKYSDHEFSFTDCTSFALMRSIGLKKAFTFDLHFVIAGFEIFPA
ncbi:PIN domain-containing protein [candidate division KSB1 bacterium]|nr:PIN domain-containing protein [candidate division KSB1 bacterium]